MLTLGFHNPFAVLGKESPKPETRASAQGASYPGVLRRALSPKSPPRSRRGSADLASPRSPPKVTQASQGESDADGTPRQPNEDVAPMVEAGTPLKAFLNALVNAELEHSLPEGYTKPDLAQSADPDYSRKLEEFIRSKYELGSFKPGGDGQLAEVNAGISTKAMDEFCGLLILGVA